MPARLLSQPGAFTITVQNPGLAASNSQTFQVRNFSITGAVPSSIVAGNPAGFSLTLQGVFGASGCIVNWGAQPLVTTYSGTNLVAIVPPNLIATVAVASLTLKCGSATSSPFPFSVLQPGVPSITSLSPSTISVGGKSTVVKVLGRNLSNWSTASQSCSNIKITNITPVSAGEFIKSRHQLRDLRSDL